MKRLFIVLVLIAAGIAGLGYYLGWFTVFVDKDKIRADEKRASDKVIGQ
jgi:uncharacterized alpha/beta hydrolase family protein